ncbi:MAG TPA: DUF4760 domain-containing protein [Beijerinckiaceae bacterium]|jgi:hypothetical protein
MTQVEATLVIGAVAALIAVWGVLTQRAIARRRATFDHIAKTEADADVIKARRKFIELAKANGGLARWAEEEHERSEEVQSIKLILNDFELIAIGIQRGIIDMEFYKRWYKSGVVRHWSHAHPFVAALRSRTRNNMLFHEFEQLAGWFDDNKAPPRKFRFWT